jgi:hypothetical protein
MMKIWILPVAVVAGALLACRPDDGAGSHNSRKPANAQPVQLPDQLAMRFEPYKSWKRVNAKPLQLSNRLIELCRQLTPAESELLAHDPHSKYFFTVYVNDIGRAAMYRKGKTLFPAGSMIVKEKLTSEKATSPVMMTAMRKGAKGSSPATGDWQYFILDPRGKVTASGDQIPHCQGCHASEPDTDYVYRTYLPEVFSYAVHGKPTNGKQGGD